MNKLLALVAIALLCRVSYQAVCAKAVFPTDNTALGSGEKADITGALTGALTISAITCGTSTTTNDAPAYAQINLPYSTSSTSAGNACSVALGSATANVVGQGVFIYNSAGAFTNQAGTTVTTGYGDVTASTTYYYVAVQSIWTGGAAPASAGTTGLLVTAVTAYCYDAAYTTYCTWVSGLTNAEATADAAATALAFGTAPTTAGQAACVFSVNPSGTMDVAITTTGSPYIGCASQTATSTYAAGSIISATTTNFASTMDVKCVNIATATTTSTGITVAATLTASSSGAFETVATIASMVSALFFFF